MKIAIIGGGISGMVAAYLLNEDHDITLFETNDYIGGHTHTVDVKREGKTYVVDTGFIVFNETTYPNFLKLIKKLGVDYQPSTMTFSVKSEKNGLEYSPHSLRSFFAQKRNIVDPSFYRMIWDIIRFRRDIDHLVREDTDEQEIGPYLRKHGYSRRFIEHFIIPLGSSLWSTDPKRIHNFPLQTFARFFKNHGFLEMEHPIAWKVIKGGSRRYTEKLTAPYADRIRLKAPVKSVIRRQDHVEVHPVHGHLERFDHVVMACHSDQALAMLKDPSSAEQEILRALPYQENHVVLHTDPSILPARRSLWSSWNYHIPLEDMDRAALTYDMNILQTIACNEEFCVTLNRPGVINRNRVIGTYIYHHPVYTKDSPRAQKRHEEISGRNRTHFCGAYWGYGFHEDGVNSALAACKFFGKGL
ncbi:MAG TPA: FAD-dependent oxidoreductase [Nitrospirota bacterium]|nr:FAD-dependent oxidoreductase [Nitrospirota bacterium]